MRYPASEKLEIIRLVENSHLSARCTLQKLGIPRSTSNRWYDRFFAGGIDALEDRRRRPNRVWNRIPEETRDQIVELALNEPELSPRELAVTFTDTKGYFVSESSIYRLLKAHDLITSPAFIVIKAADEFHDKTTAPNQIWQTDLTYAFRLVSEKAFERDRMHVFEPLSITTYADGHRMLSVTGAVVRRDEIESCRDKTNRASVPGGVETWDAVVDILIPQLTVWEKLTLDRELHSQKRRRSQPLNFRLHETVSTKDLLDGYQKFQRFYPTFRHVLL